MSKKSRRSASGRAIERWAADWKVGDLMMYRKTQHILKSINREPQQELWELECRHGRTRRFPDSPHIKKYQIHCILHDVKENEDWVLGLALGSQEDANWETFVETERDVGNELRGSRMETNIPLPIWSVNQQSRVDEEVKRIEDKYDSDAIIAEETNLRKRAAVGIIEDTFPDWTSIVAVNSLEIESVVNDAFEQAGHDYAGQLEIEKHFFEKNGYCYSGLIRSGLEVQLKKADGNDYWSHSHWHKVDVE